jgi:hypothetical protein
MPAGVNESRWAKARRIADASPSAPRERYTKQYWAYVRGIYNNMSSGDEPGKGDKEAEAEGFRGWVGERAGKAAGWALSTRPGQAFVDALLNRAVKPRADGSTYLSRYLDDPANRERIAGETRKMFRGWMSRHFGRFGESVADNPIPAAGVAVAALAIPALMMRRRRDQAPAYYPQSYPVQQPVPYQTETLDA